MKQKAKGEKAHLNSESKHIYSWLDPHMKFPNKTIRILITFLKWKKNPLCIPLNDDKRRRKNSSAKSFRHDSGQ